MILLLVVNKKFINIAKKTLNASTKEIKELLSNQEINQINKT